MDTLLVNAVDEDALRRFEAAWQSGTPAAIESFLPPDDDPAYLPTLEELIQLELEFGWKAVRGSSDDRLRGGIVEKYLSRFPRLNEEGILRRLLKQEYACRQRFGDKPDPAEYRNRFPQVIRSTADLDESDAATLQMRFAARSDETIGQGGPTVSAPTIPGYEIRSLLGRGGMGTVFLAQHVGLKRSVALKMLRAGAMAGTDELTRFRSEAEALARLQHSNIVRVYDVGQAAECPYFTMEYAPGGNLAEALTKNPLAARPAAELVETLARAVHAAHEQGILHRDLKPANVLMASDGRVMLTDFGLAKQLPTADSDAASGEPTATGVVIGTPSYMSPEQAQGRARTVGPASDVYSLGAILYECLTGRPPFRGETAIETLDHVRTLEPVPPSRLRPSVPRDLETIALKCLQKEPCRRFGSAQELADDLRRYLDGRPIHARRASTAERAVKWMRRRPAAAALIGVAILVGIAAVVAGLLYRKEREESRAAAAAHERTARATELVKALGSAETAMAPRLIRDLADVQPEAAPLLHDLRAESPADSKPWLHARLALAPFESPAVRDLAEYLLRARADELATIRDALRERSQIIAPMLWQTVQDARTPAAARIRAACALAGLGPADDPRWSAVAADLAGLLVRESPLDAAAWAAALETVRRSLVPPLLVVLDDRSHAVSDPALPRNDVVDQVAQINVAVQILTRFVADDPAAIAKLLLGVDRPHFDSVISVARPHGSAVRSELMNLVAPSAVAAGSQSNEAVRDHHAQRIANAAAALLALGDGESIWPLFRHSADDSARNFLIHRLGERGIDPAALIRRFSNEPDVSARRAIVQALGEYSDKSLPESQRSALIPALLSDYSNLADPGLHSSIEWLLRRWGRGADVDRIDGERRGPPGGSRNWFVNSRGMTFAVVRGPVEFQMGSPASEDQRITATELLHRQRIGRSFAVATKELTAVQFDLFLDANPSIRRLETNRFNPDPNGPAAGLTWFKAAAYCRWLSEQEGVPEDQMVYPKLEEIKPGMLMPANYLSRTGYRLPTEAEWEFSARAGAETSYHFGVKPTLEAKYGWTVFTAADRAWPCGQFKPNDLGLFDTYGNVWEWCQDPDHRYAKDEPGKPVEDVEFPGPITGERPRYLRGGAYSVHARNSRSASRVAPVPIYTSYSNGVRLVRTIPTP